MKMALRVTTRECPMLTPGSTLTPVSFSTKPSPVFRAQLGARETWSPDLALSLESCLLVICFVLGTGGAIKGCWRVNVSVGMRHRAPRRATVSCPHTLASIMTKNLLVQGRHVVRAQKIGPVITMTGLHA